MAQYLLMAERVRVRQQMLPSSQCIVNYPKHRWSLSDRFSGGCGAASIDFKSLRFAPRTMSPSARRDTAIAFASKGAPSRASFGTSKVVLAEALRH
jgi:hypothetical protein